MQKDLVIGAVTGYSWDQIKYWANSLDRSGFSGYKAIIAYNMDFVTLHELEKRGYQIVAFQKDDEGQRTIYPSANFNIVVDRFLHYYTALSMTKDQDKVRYVIATDVRDVIFQENPSEYLNAAEMRNSDFVMSSEGIAYQHEPWGANNLLQAFGPVMYEKHKENIIINCGVLTGKFNAFLGLCKTIWLTCVNATQHVPGGGGPDQAALNLLLSTPVYEHITEITTHDGSWAAQLGTMMDPTKLEAYRPFITEPLPVFDQHVGSVIVNTRGTPYTIVHQWDRAPEVKDAFERLYA